MIDPLGNGASTEVAWLLDSSTVYGTLVRPSGPARADGRRCRARPGGGPVGWHSDGRGGDGCLRCGDCPFHRGGTLHARSILAAVCPDVATGTCQSGEPALCP